MTYGRRASKKDLTHNPIAAAFVKNGCSVLDLSKAGNSCLDMLIAIQERTALIECKTGNRPLTKGQQEFCQMWRGKVYVARSVDDVPVIVRQLLEGI